MMVQELTSKYYLIMEKKKSYELEREEFTWTPPEEMIKDLEK